MPIVDASMPLLGRVFLAREASPGQPELVAQRLHGIDWLIAPEELMRQG